VKILLDTHSFIWFIEGNASLKNEYRVLVENPDNEVFLSIASVWEMAIKDGLGKLELSQPLETLLPSQLSHNNISLLNISLNHALAVAKLPLHHRDPFDRLLIAQSLVEEIPLLTVDSIFTAYGVKQLNL
jgi:PIN domain nuclease of toxin-antitoxin system